MDICGGFFIEKRRKGGINMKKHVLTALAVLSVLGIMFACTACSRMGSTASADRGNVNELNGNTKGAREETTSVNGIIDENADVNTNGIEDVSEYADEGIGEKISDAARDAGDAVKDTAENAKDKLTETATRAKELG